MEGKTTIGSAQAIMGNNFIGPKELCQIADTFPIAGMREFELNVPTIPYSVEFLENLSSDHILILGTSHSNDDDLLTINKMRSYFGINPSLAEPCFYNQDWYLNHDFASKNTLENKWYFLKKNILDGSRGVEPKNIELFVPDKNILPSAILCSYVFFAWWLLNDEILWKNDYVWCGDFDNNGDRIYVGHYIDPFGLGKQGFEIHRHLSITKKYGLIYQPI
jgi:hypothetical protein